VVAARETGSVRPAVVSHWPTGLRAVDVAS
jgi:hypothetical protein